MVSTLQKSYLPYWNYHNDQLKNTCIHKISRNIADCGDSCCGEISSVSRNISIFAANR